MAWLVCTLAIGGTVAPRLRAHAIDDAAQLRVELMRIQPSRGLGDVDHEVAAALQLVRDAERAGTEPDISVLEAAVAEEGEALVLDRVPNRVDVVVIVDDLLGAGKIGLDERVGAGRDRPGRERSEADDAEGQIADLCIEVGRLHRLIIGVTGSELTPSFRLFARCSPSRHSDATASLQALHTIRVR